MYAIGLRAVGMVPEGLRRDGTARVKGMERAALAGWVRRYNGRGPKGLVSRPNGGSAYRLDVVQRAAVQVLGPAMFYTVDTDYDVSSKAKCP